MIPETLSKFEEFEGKITKMHRNLSELLNRTDVIFNQLMDFEEMFAEMVEDMKTKEEKESK